MGIIYIHEFVNLAGVGEKEQQAKPSTASPAKAGVASFLPQSFSGHRKWEEKPASLFLPLTLSISEEIPTEAPKHHRGTAPEPQRKTGTAGSAFGIPDWSGFLSKEQAQGKAFWFLVLTTGTLCSRSPVRVAGCWGAAN